MTSDFQKKVLNLVNASGIKVNLGEPSTSDCAVFVSTKGGVWGSETKKMSKSTHKS